MAKIEDYVNKNDDKKEKEPVDTQLELSELETEESTPNQPESPKEESLPNKYAGKSMAELARMHQEAESVIGRQGNEMGELRTAVNKLIEDNLKATQVPEGYSEGAQESDVDFFADPVKSVRDLVDKHPTVAKAKETTDRLEKQGRQSEIMKRHPDVDQVFADPGFREWIEKSPHRKQQLLKADKDYDVDAGDALLTDYKEIKAARAGSSETKKSTVTTPNIKAAQTGSLKGGGGNQRTGKIIYRADIVELQRTNPKRYNEMLPAIRKAYAEGRVRTH